MFPPLLPKARPPAFMLREMASQKKKMLREMVEGMVDILRKTLALCSLQFPTRQAYYKPPVASSLAVWFVLFMRALR